MRISTVANTRPYTEAHAIASLDIAVVLSDKLTTEQQEELHAELAKLLAEDQFASKEATRPGLVAFERKSSDGDIIEELHIHPTFVHVFWNEYRGWTFARELALRRLGPVIDRVRAGLLKADGVGMAFEDIFVNDDPAEFELIDVLQPNSRFVPAIAYEDRASFWKTSFSYVVGGDEEGDHATYSSLAIEASQASSREEDGSDTDADENEVSHSTRILHRQSLYLNPGNRDAGTEVQWSEKSVRGFLNRLHDQNKSLMLELLSEDMINRIGLKE